MGGALSGSQLDLVIHGTPGDPIAPGHCPPAPKIPQENINCAFLMSEKNNYGPAKNKTQDPESDPTSSP